MAGWRLGCIVGPERLLEPLLKIHSHTASFVSPFIQKAGVAALTGPQDHIAEWRAQCEQLATQVANRLNAVPGVQCNVPQGATFLFPRYSAEISSKDMAGLLVDQHGVVVTPGSGFGNAGEGHFRVALMRSPAEQVMQGVDRIANALESMV
jgi:aspartate aminotransferase